MEAARSNPAELTHLETEARADLSEGEDLSARKILLLVEEVRRLQTLVDELTPKTDYTVPAEVERGRGGQLLRVSPTLQKLQVLTSAAPGGLDGMVRWLEAQEGTKGRRQQPFVLVTDDGRCSQIREPQPDKIYSRGR